VQKDKVKEKIKKYKEEKRKPTIKEEFLTDVEEKKEWSKSKNPKKEQDISWVNLDQTLLKIDEGQE